MKISGAVARVLRVPYAFPLATEPTYAKMLLVEIATDDGVVGYACSGTPMVHEFADLINNTIAPMIIGQDPMRTEYIRKLILVSTAFKYFLGAWSCMASLVDIALWDIKGKSLGQPVWKLLGGAKTELPTYVTFGLATYSVEELVEVGKGLVAEGHKGLKMIVGATLANEFDRGFDDIDVYRDAKRVAALREAVGPGISIMIDGNKSLRFDQALKLARMCEPYDVTWFEDPIRQGDPRLMADLRRQIDIPLACGSTGTSDLILLREYVMMGAVDYLQPNVRDIGGFTMGAKASALAQCFNIPLSMGGNYPHLNMHLHAGFDNGGPIEFHYAGWKCYELLFEGAVSPKNGKITLTDAPGLGLVPRSEMLDFAIG